eukprot:903757-Amphidinium_carterae.1
MDDCGSSSWHAARQATKPNPTKMPHQSSGPQKPLKRFFDHFSKLGGLPFKGFLGPEICLN